MPRAIPRRCFPAPSGISAPSLDAALADVRAGRPAGKDYSAYSFMTKGGNDIVFDSTLVPAALVGPMEAKRAAIKAGTYTVVIDKTEPT